MALNSASALDLATTGSDYFLLLQVTRFPPTKVKYPEVDLLLSLESAQSASMPLSFHDLRTKFLFQEWTSNISKSSRQHPYEAFMGHA